MRDEPARVEFEGTRFTVECLQLADGSCPAGAFLDGLNASDRRKLDVLFERIGDHGEIRNREKFKRVEGSDHIYEFKSFDIRIPCFFAHDRRIVLAFGLRKKTDRWRKPDLRRAEEYRRWYMAQPRSR